MDYVVDYVCNEYGCESCGRCYLAFHATVGMMNTNWYQKYVSKLSIKLSKRLIKDCEDEEV
jgi:hypothetical protein